MKSKHKFFWAVILISIFTMSLACQKQNAEWQGTIEEVDGVTVVKNPDEPLYGEITFDLEEDLSIGREDDKNYMFYRARNIALDSHENIYVLDSGNHRIQKFDKNGRFLQTIGEKRTGSRGI